MTSSQLSDHLEDKVTQETYGLFPVPITRYSVPNHEDLKQQILNWMSKQELLTDHKRQAICHNVLQVGPNNQLLNDIPDVAKTLLAATTLHNNNSFK